MGLFDFLKSDSNEIQGENLQSVESNESSISPAGYDASTSQSAEVIRKTRSRKNKENDTGKRAFSLEEPDNAQLEQAAKTLELLLDPKVWKGAVSAPGDAMVAITGREHWKISDDEADTLAKTGAATVRAFMVTDPKWLALSLFSFSIMSIYGSRFLKDLDLKKKAQNKIPESNVAA